MFSHVVGTMLWSLVLLEAAPSQAQTPSENSNFAFVNEAQYSYADPNSGLDFVGVTNSLAINSELIDPFGRLLGCAGEPLSSYDGFAMRLYESNPADPTGTELGTLVRLTPTEFPNVPGNGIGAGLRPNVLNVNPFFLSDADGGAYNFLLDPQAGQVVPGKTYILVIQPPPNSIYIERRIKLKILASTGNSNQLRYLATSLDGQPIAADGSTQVTQDAVVNDAANVGLNLLSLQLATVLCQPNQVAITKTADRATAEPGDVVIYRLAVRNQSDVALQALSLLDRLPQGFRLLEDSVKAEIAGERIETTIEMETVSQALIRTSTTLPAQGTMTVIYAVQITPDAARGSGKNAVVLEGQRIDNGFLVQDGPAIHELRVRPGITADCGVLIGRVFEDHNRDGEQQRHEPGIPNAVIYLQDGNRVVTDDNGLFSVANVLPGYHTGVLDLASVPGYQLAPNHYRREFNSDSRLVRLAPSSMARMNFPVISIAEEAQ